jgi:hypothetical protein
MSNMDLDISEEVLKERYVEARLWRLFGIDWQRKNILALSQGWSLSVLEKEYQQICLSYNRKYLKADRYRTEYEFRFLRRFIRGSRTQCFQGVWIGRSCFDFFFPGIAGGFGNNRLRGLALEIDGSIHQAESKMRKDEFKGDFLRRLGIGHYSIANDNVNNQSLAQIISLNKTHRVLDTRAKERLWRIIYTVTIIGSGMGFLAELTKEN